MFWQQVSETPKWAYLFFTNPNELIQISLESPWKYLTGEINLASKFHVFLKWLTKWKKHHRAL